MKNLKKNVANDGLIKIVKETEEEERNVEDLNRGYPNIIIKLEVA